MWFPFGLLCVFISPFALLLYALYASAYAAIYGWDAWQRKVEAWDRARFERLQRERDQDKRG